MSLFGPVTESIQIHGGKVVIQVDRRSGIGYGVVDVYNEGHYPIQVGLSYHPVTDKDVKRDQEQPRGVKAVPKQLTDSNSKELAQTLVFDRKRKSTVIIGLSEKAQANEIKMVTECLNEKRTKECAGGAATRCEVEIQALVALKMLVMTLKGERNECTIEDVQELFHYVKKELSVDLIEFDEEMAFVPRGASKRLRGDDGQTDTAR